MKKSLTKIFHMLSCNRGIIFFLVLLVLAGCVTVPPKTEKKEISVPSEPQQYLRYIVQRGDTLWKISQMAYNDSRKWEKIYEANKDKIKDVQGLKPGEIIIIPIE